MQPSQQSPEPCTDLLALRTPLRQWRVTVSLILLDTEDSRQILYPHWPFPVIGSSQGHLKRHPQYYNLIKGSWSPTQGPHANSTHAGPLAVTRCTAVVVQFRLNRLNWQFSIRKKDTRTHTTSVQYYLPLVLSRYDFIRKGFPKRKKRNTVTSN